MMYYDREELDLRRAAAIRRERLMRRMAVACASVVGGCQAVGCVFLAALLYIAWLNPARVDAVMLFATLASAALLAASLFSLAYWFCDTRG